MNIHVKLCDFFVILHEVRIRWQRLRTKRTTGDKNDNDNTGWPRQRTTTDDDGWRQWIRTADYEDSGRQERRRRMMTMDDHDGGRRGRQQTTTTDKDSGRQKWAMNSDANISVTTIQEKSQSQQQMKSTPSMMAQTYLNDAQTGLTQHAEKITAIKIYWNR